MPGHWNWGLPCPAGTENHSGWKFSLNSDRSWSPQQSKFLGAGRSVWNCLKVTAHSWFRTLSGRMPCKPCFPQSVSSPFLPSSLTIALLACSFIHSTSILATMCWALFQALLIMNKPYKIPAPKSLHSSAFLKRELIECFSSALPPFFSSMSKGNDSYERAVLWNFLWMCWGYQVLMCWEICEYTSQKGHVTWFLVHRRSTWTIWNGKMGGWMDRLLGKSITET